MDFIIADKQYRAEKLDSFKALHVARRIAPIVGHLALASTGTVKPEDMIGPLMSGLAEMKEEDFDYVRDTCLAVVKREDSGAWNAIFNKNAKMLQYQDIGPGAIVQIIMRVVVDNISDFLGDLPQIGTGGA